MINSDTYTKVKKDIIAPIGAVMVIGGGISGMQSALDLANSGFKVYLIEESPAVGGKMAQLDKTFPTNDCAMCIVSPKLVELSRHENIELLSYSKLTELSGSVGHFQTRIEQKSRYVDPNKCTGCGQCEIVCPVTHAPYFPVPEVKTVKQLNTIAYKTDVSLKQKAHWKFVIDEDKCKKCGMCSRNCPAYAIEWQKKETARIIQADCIACGQCYISCPVKADAIKIEQANEISRSLSAAILTRSAELKSAYADCESEQDCIRCGLCSLMCHKVIGAKALKLGKNGIEARQDLCIACGSCISVCPVGFLDINDLSNKTPRPILSEFNEGLSGRKPIYIKYPQAVPRVPVIDEDFCVKLNTGNCGTCKSHCDANAIDYQQKEIIHNIEIGSVIFSPGYEVFPAGQRAEFGYGIYKNVVTSLEFERLLSASGPTSGKITRPGDGSHPKKLAWIQCIGSRDNSCDRDYCSSICCMYASKEAVIAKEHDKDVEATIFYIDLRSFGKNFDSYVERAKDHHKVRYTRAMVSRIFENPVSGDLELRYIDENGKKQREIFDMAILSVGIQIPKATKKLARLLDISTDDFGFALTNTYTPLLTSRPGVFVSGAFNGPKDIPETVSEASGAAADAASILADSRGSLIAEQVLPSSISDDNGELRIGVFICHCGINIASVVDVAKVTEYAKTLPGVVYAEHPLYTCSQDTQERIRQIIKEYSLNRIVVAACSPRTHEPVFQQTMQQTGLNKYLFDMANIRDQCSWVHQDNHPAATVKSMRLVKMAVANVSKAEQLQEQQFDVIPRLLVIGGGLAGMTAAIEAAKQNFRVYLVEQDRQLGGNLNRVRRSFDGKNVRNYLKNLVDTINSNEMINVFTNSMVVEHRGFIGNFETDIITPAGVSRTVKHGAIIVATGAYEYRPDIYGLNENEKVLTQLDFEELLEEKSNLGKDFPHVAIILCAGSRSNEHLNYCSRTCCNQAIKNALRYKTLSPKARVDILYRDIRSYGHGEILYHQARTAGINFIRYDAENNLPKVDTSDSKPKIKIYDPSIRLNIDLAPDLLVLSTGTKPYDTEELATMLRVPRAKDGFFIEAHAKLRPVDFASEGLFLAGLAHAPKSISESITQAKAAVARAATILSKKSLLLSGVVSTVDPEHCAVCLTCVRACPYHVPFINDKHSAEINPALCQGCGICVAECPAQTISLGSYRNENLIAKIEAYQTL